MSPNANMRKRSVDGEGSPRGARPTKAVVTFGPAAADCPVCRVLRQLDPDGQEDAPLALRNRQQRRALLAALRRVHRGRRPLADPHVDEAT